MGRIKTSKLPRWKAYGDLIHLAKEHFKCKPDRLSELLNADAKKREFYRSTYSLRTIYHLQKVPKDSNGARRIRWYRVEHLYIYFQDLLKKLGAEKTYAKHLRAIAPSTVDGPSLVENMAQDNLIAVDLSAFSRKLKPLQLQHDKIENFGDLTDKVYLALGEKYLRAYSYGSSWLLCFKKNGLYIKNMRMIKKLVGYQGPVPDLRSLATVGIKGGTELRAVYIVARKRLL